jgi:hypothetical protein
MWNKLRCQTLYESVFKQNEQLSVDFSTEVLSFMLTIISTLRVQCTSFNVDTNIDFLGLIKTKQKFVLCNIKSIQDFKGIRKTRTLLITWKKTHLMSDESRARF